MIDNEFYKVKKNTSKDYSNRYKNCSLLEDIDTGDILLSTREIYEIPPTSQDSYHRVKSNEVGRLDLIAHNYYKNPLLWWVIAQANNIYDPFISISPGDLLRIPSIESLYGNNGILL